MKYIPYKSINNIKFGSSENNIIKELGNPISISQNKLEMKELNYENGIYRLNKSNEITEATLNIKDITLSDKNVSFENLQEFLSNNDAESFETVGFYVSPKYGLSFDPDHKFWVTMFKKSELKEWKNIGTK